MFETQRLNYSRGITGELGNIKWLSVACGATDSAIVEENEFVRRCESINERRIPVRTCRGETIHEDKRSATSNSMISDLRSVDLNCASQLTKHRRQ